MYFKLSVLVFVFLRSVCVKAEPNWEDCPRDEEADLIDCSNFGFTQIPLDIYDSSWRYIRLNRNPFNCNCSMSTFFGDDRYVEYLERTPDLFDARCAQPTVYAGVKMLRLADDPTFCKHGHEEFEQGVPNWKDCKGNRKQHRLDCRNKELKTPPVGVLDQEVFKFIYLSRNPFVCDCNMARFIERLKHRKHRGIIKDKTDLECSEPKELAGIKFTEIIEKEISVCRKISCKDKPCIRGKERCVQDGEFYECICAKGFRKQDSSGKCEDADECSESDSCPVNAECRNTIGSYMCGCYPGYRRKDEECLDVDECKSGEYECQENATCVNTMGRYECHCKGGYVLDNDGKTCIETAQESVPFITVNSRLIASAVLVFFLFILGMTTCLGRCRKDKYSSDNELLLSTSTGNTKKIPPFISKLFGYTSYTDMTPSSNRWPEDEDDVIYEYMK